MVHIHVYVFCHQADICAHARTCARAHLTIVECVEPLSCIQEFKV